MKHLRRSSAPRVILLVAAGLIATLAAPAAATLDQEPATAGDGPGSAAVRSAIDAQNPLIQWERGLAEHADAFAGIVLSESSITILQAARDAAFEARALAGPPENEYARATGSHLAVVLASAQHSLRDLNATRDAIEAQLTDLGSSGTWGVGLKVQENRVLVLTTDAAATRAALEDSGHDLSLIDIEVELQPVNVAGRYSDSPPWNGGDYLNAIDAQLAGSSAFCTSGFGVHSGSYSNRYLSTAGHCGPHIWYNGASEVGRTLNNHVITGPVLDSQIIPAWSSCIVWRGLSTTDANLQRWLLTGWFNATGGTVYLEGSVSTERIGAITASNMTYTVTDPVYGTYTIQQAFRVNQPSLGGDSGGPVVQPTGYGPLSIGSIIATNGTSTFAQYFSAYLYSYGVQLNITVNPNYCTNS